MKLTSIFNSILWVALSSILLANCDNENASTLQNADNIADCSKKDPNSQDQLQADGGDGDVHDGNKPIIADGGDGDVGGSNEQIIVDGGDGDVHDDGVIYSLASATHSKKQTTSGHTDEGLSQPETKSAKDSDAIQKTCK